MQAESRDFGITYGITFPVRDRHGAVSLFTGDASDAHEFSVDRARGTLAVKVGKVDLTLRERQWPLWTLEGKTAKDIVVILHLSVFTVNRYAHNATHKPGSLNKYHAAVQAFRAGLI